MPANIFGNDDFFVISRFFSKDILVKDRTNFEIWQFSLKRYFSVERQTYSTEKNPR